MNETSDSIERLSRDTRPQPARREPRRLRPLDPPLPPWRGGHPATACKAAALALIVALSPAAGAADALPAGAEPPPQHADWVAAVATDAAAISEAEFRDRFLMPLLREEALEPLLEGPDADAPWIDEATNYVERELLLAWEGPGRMPSRPHADWGRAYDFTVKEGSRDPFLTWMSVVGQKKWHWDDKARVQLAGLEEALAALPEDEAAFPRLLAAHARQLLDPAPEHRVALCEAAVRWAESHAGRPERSEAVLRALEQFVDVEEPSFVSALLESEADPWIGLVAAGRSSFALHFRDRDAERREMHVDDAEAAWGRAWELHPEMPQGAEGLMRVASHRRDRAGIDAWFREGVAARYDSPSLHDRYVAFLRPAYGGSLEALVEHAWSCLDAANPGCFGDDAALERERSMLPYGGVLAFLAALDVSGERPARFFGGTGVLGEICAALAPMLAPHGAGTSPGDYDATMHARFESAWFLASLLWTFGDADGALQAFETVDGVPDYYCRRLQQTFPGTFDIYLALAGLSGPNAGLVRPLYERFRSGDAEGFLAHWEEAFEGEPLERRETGLLERLAIRAFLAARFPDGESRRVPITSHREFVCWHGYGIGWQPEPDDEGGYAWFTGKQPYACFEFGVPLPTPLEIETSFELTPDPATNALFAIRLFPADLRFSDHRGKSPVLSVRVGPDGDALLRLGCSGERYIDCGYTQGTLAEANVLLSDILYAEGAEDESHAESAEFAESVGRARSPSAPAPARVSLRVVYLEDRVRCYLGDAQTPAIDAPCAAFAPAALPDGAKLVFYGVDCKFFGFTFRNPVPDSPARKESRP